jgi:hypothetical protein
MQSVDITATIEYQVAKFAEQNLPGWRVLAPGSIAQWMNTFSKVPQFTGGSFPTAANVVQLHAASDLVGVGEAAVPALWHKAYGVDAVVVAGRDSPEFWRPHPHGHQFDGVYPVLWDEQDTRIYAVPRPVRTLAHVIPKGAAVSRVPAGLSDTAQVERYVAALDAAAVSSAATFAWLGDSRARIHATLGSNQVLSVQVTQHPGWKATAGARAIPVSKDGLGMMILTPRSAGEYTIDLVYDGGWESRLCRAASAITWLLILIAAAIGYISGLLRNSSSFKRNSTI